MNNAITLALRFDPSALFMLVPKGIFPITQAEKSGGTTTYEQVVDDRSVSEIVAAFNRRRAADRNFKVLIDFEHFSHDTSKSSEAAAWVEEMHARPDGVWARATWSDAGEAAVKNRRYRYLSPVWRPSQTEKLGGNRFRPVELSDAGLTNKPNMGGALQPFWNRADDGWAAAEATAPAPALYLSPAVHAVNCIVHANTGTDVFLNRFRGLAVNYPELTDGDIIARVFAEEPDMYECYRLGITQVEGRALKNRASESDEPQVHTMIREVVDENSGHAFERLRTALRIDPRLDRADAFAAIFNRDPSFSATYRNALLGR